jgi:hypothetical protein
MDVNYGQAIKEYLLERVTLLHIHRFNPADAQFSDAIVSSAVVWFRKTRPPSAHTVTFTFGGTLAVPKVTRFVSTSDLAQERKWTRFPGADVRVKAAIPTISDFFQIRRGLATGNNNYFILSAEDIKARGLPIEAFRPILPSPRHLVGDEVLADDNGSPVTERRLFLLDTKHSEDEIKDRLPALHNYIEEGKIRGLHNGYLCRHRSPWYAQEKRPHAPIVCTYMGRCDSKRGRPFRFILNNSVATVTNVYLAMYPTQSLANALVREPALIRDVWRILNAIEPEQILNEGRVYGGGLNKLEPKELANVPVPEIADVLPPERPPTELGLLNERVV